MNFNKILLLFISCVLITIVLPVSGFCELKAMNDEEMTDIYATGFSDFQINDLGGGITETVAWFNIHTYEYIEIDSLKLGYHDEYDYKNPTPSFDWDQDWENITIGTDYEDPSTDFHAEGFYFAAEFENINNPATRELKSFRFGFDYVQGDISADFINFSGTIDNSNDNTPEYNGHIMNLGPVTITADPGNIGDGGFEISLSIDDYDKGYWVTFDRAVVTP
ncbi:MAG: hypothetical protein HF978_19815 [Desulfobacteraceae bacterium]|nr:hypothetical protein [Desulfobacteraceae bacterium]MBC2757796.1 hypothetical protein [Desulfobacteraceae bacterium]